MPHLDDANSLTSQSVRSLLDGLPFISFIIDDRMDVLAWNSLSGQALGWQAEEMIGQPITKAAADSFTDVRESFLRALAGKTRVSKELMWQKRDGTTFFARLHASGIQLHEVADPCVLMVVDDLTGVRLLEDQRTAEKLDAISRFARVVGHDFNNLLANIDGYARLIMDRHEPAPSAAEIVGIAADFQDALVHAGDVRMRQGTRQPDEDHTDAERIVDQANRAAVLTSQMLTIGGRKHNQQSKVIEVGRVLADVSDRLRGLLGANITLRLSLADEPMNARCDAFDLEQVLVHLIMNARDAMPNGGSVTVKAVNGRLDEPSATASGSQVTIEVSDSGSGIPDIVLPHIFEPYFSTKEKHAGLGLSLAYNIVKRQGGTLRTARLRGSGASFVIVLKGPLNITESGKELPGQAPDYRGNETILLVEDKANVRHLMSLGLRERGYNVLEATGPAEALALYQLDPISIQVLLTDVIMPGGSGLQLRNDLTALRPTLKTLYVSGRNEDVLRELGLLDSDAPFLQKPFTPEALARAIRILLDGKPRTD